MNFLNLFKSRTVWSAIVAVAGSVLGLTADEGAQAQELVGQLMAVVGGLSAIWFRRQARIDLKPE
jgi:hypothetical protein